MPLSPALPASEGAAYGSVEENEIYNLLCEYPLRFQPPSSTPDLIQPTWRLQTWRWGGRLAIVQAAQPALLWLMSYTRMMTDFCVADEPQHPAPAPEEISGASQVVRAVAKMPLLSFKLHPPDLPPTDFPRYHEVMGKARAANAQYTANELRRGRGSGMNHRDGREWTLLTWNFQTIVDRHGRNCDVKSGMLANSAAEEWFGFQTSLRQAEIDVDCAIEQFGREHRRVDRAFKRLQRMRDDAYFFGDQNAEAGWDESTDSGEDGGVELNETQEGSSSVPPLPSTADPREGMPGGAWGFR